ncbi:MAG: hypothetical protein V9E99_03210 [Microthrixaceae bacterium]
MRHDLGRRTERADGQAAADHLAERPQVGAHAKPGRRAAGAQAEPRDHLVEQQQRSHAVALGAQLVEEPLGGRHQTHVGGHRLDAQHRHRLVELGDHVPRHHHGVGDGAGGHTVGPREALVGHARAARGEQRVGVPVVHTRELHDRRPARRARGRAALPT